MRKIPDSLTARELAGLIDISAVQAEHGDADIRRLAGVAREHGFIAAHALPNFVPLLRELLPPGGPTLVGGPIGFPSGGHMTATKLAEARALVAAGADELDMMINLGRLRSGDDAYVRDEIRAVAQAIAPVPLKVIVEMASLNDDELRRAALLAVEGGAAFVKTGTGWRPGAATAERIAVIFAAIGQRAEVKASGGIRSLTAIAGMLRLGVTRFGINPRVAVALVQECQSLPGGRLVLK